MSFFASEDYLSVGAKFDRFLSNIELTTAQQNDADTKHNGVRQTLHRAYYTTTYTGSTSFLVGSYKKNTATRPPSDIDIMFVMPTEYYQRYNALQGNKQSRLLQDIKGLLGNTYQNTDLRADGQVVCVPFISFAIEVAPCFKLTNGNYYICDTNGGGKWKETAPQAEMDALTASNTRTNGNTVGLIKMTKVWKYYCSVPIKSLTIELMAEDFLNSYTYASKTSTYYDWMVRDFFLYMTRYANYNFFIPGTREPLPVGNDWLSKAQSAYARATKACDNERDKYPLLATDEWKKIFGDFFIG